MKTNRVANNSKVHLRIFQTYASHIHKVFLSFENLFNGLELLLVSVSRVLVIHQQVLHSLYLFMQAAKYELSHLLLFSLLFYFY